MPDWPFVSYPTDPYLTPTAPQTFLYPSFRGEVCASWRPDLTPRGQYIAYAGATSPLGNTIVQGVPYEMIAVSSGPPSSAVGPNLAGTGANGSGGPGIAIWTNPTYLSSTSSYATASLATSPSAYGGSQYAYATNFGFSIPVNFTLVGINVIGNAYSDASADFVSLQLQLLKAGQPVGSPKTIPLTSSAAPFTVGSNGDLWGVGLLASDVNQSNFGVCVAAIYQGSQSSGVHTWSVNNINLTLYAQDPSTSYIWVGSGNNLYGVFSLPVSEGGTPIAQWSASSIGIIESLTDVRPRQSGLTAMPIINGFQEVTTDDPTMLRTLDNSFHVRTDHLQSTGKVYVGAGQIHLPNNTVVTWNGAGPPNYFYQGPFVRNGVIAGKQAVIGRSGLADAVAGIVQVYIDNTGAITWNDAPAPPTPVTAFPSNVFPLAVCYVDSAARLYDIVDCRPAS